LVNGKASNKDDESNFYKQADGRCRLIVVDESHHAKALTQYQLVLAGEVRSEEFKLKTPFIMENGEAIDRWVFTKTYPQHDENKNIVSIIGCSIDISISKLHYFNQIERVEEAKHLKQQQDVRDLFIVMFTRS